MMTSGWMGIISTQDKIDRPTSTSSWTVTLEVALGRWGTGQASVWHKLRRQLTTVG
jgi:hypothetical protein